MSKELKIIYYLTLDDLNDENIVNNYIYPNMEENYYWSDDYSAQFYVKAAELGFITTSMYEKDKFILLPEIQFEYALLDFDEIRISKKIKKLLNKKNYILKINNNFSEVFERINKYHENSWLNKDYLYILNKIKNCDKLNKKFKLMSVELREKETNLLISGEIGYEFKKIYTSLSGFTTREKKYNNWGKLQLVLLNYYLKENSFKFWNLGHPQLEYKTNLGAKIYNRQEFLKRLNNEK